jgi:hypothetical protein
LSADDLEREYFSIGDCVATVDGTCSVEEVRVIFRSRFALAPVKPA